MGKKKVRKASRGKRRGKKRQGVPDEILQNVALNKAIKVLPSNYEFEIHKTIWKVNEAKAKCVALQFPEGLQMFACVIGDIIVEFSTAESTLILADVTYGACCVDDFSAKAAGADFLVHYGHSCLVPIAKTSIKSMYVFVSIGIDILHLVECIAMTFEDKGTQLSIQGTIQFAAAVAGAAKGLRKRIHDIVIPQAKPLSRGETLGCTAPKIEAGESLFLLLMADSTWKLQ